jgi:hypothetical protein
MGASRKEGWESEAGTETMSSMEEEEEGFICPFFCVAPFGDIMYKDEYKNI